MGAPKKLGASKSFKRGILNRLVLLGLARVMGTLGLAPWQMTMTTVNDNS